MASINPYLNFPGNTEEAFNFYKSVFGGDFAFVQRFKDGPEQPGGKVPAGLGDKIMHISLPIGKSNMLMGTDAMEEMGQKLTAGNNFHLTVSADSKQEADKIFQALSAGGKVTVPIETAFWGAYFGMVTDKFGIQWMVSYDEKTHAA
jgi:PhnB protein